jgi:hypothetical protein
MENMSGRNKRNSKKNADTDKRGGKNSEICEVVKYRKISSKTIVIDDESEIVVKALQNIGEDDPALILDWINVNVLGIVNALNANPPQLLPWLGINHFPITTDELTLAIVGYAAAFGGGSVGHVLFAPNDFRQFGKVMTALGHLCTDPVFVRVSQGLNLPLAEVYSLGDKQNKTTAQRDHFPNVPPHGVQLFS